MNLIEMNWPFAAVLIALITGGVIIYCVRKSGGM